MDDIPHFKIREVFDINQYFEQLYENEKLKIVDRCEPNNIGQQLNKFRQILDNYRNIYNNIFNHLHNGLKADLKTNKYESILSYKISGPNYYYTGEQKYFEEKAFDNFYLNLLNKNYRCDVYEKEEKNGLDPDGPKNCFRYIKIALK